MIARIGDIRSDYEGFARLTRLAAETAGCAFETVEIDMSGASWIEANMCAPFGGLLYRIGAGFNTVRLVGMQTAVESILCRNGFLEYYGRHPRPDVYQTTVRYMPLEPGDARYFGAYIQTELLGKGLPEMSLGLVRKFTESIFEIFSNAAIHSRTELGIYSCGQFFPKKHRLDFCVADMGVGIPANVNERTGLGLDPDEAIAWAMEGTNTTRTRRIPGGLGLKLLREFITMNEGRIQIASGGGFWELQRGRPRLRRFADPFPGTAVNIEINTADTKAYRLSSEQRPEDLF